MKHKITGSIVATNGSNIKNSKNTYTINQVRKESIIISFVVGFIASLISSYIFEYFIK